jgi:hypothetical protein
VDLSLPWSFNVAELAALVPNLQSSPFFLSSIIIFWSRKSSAFKYASSRYPLQSMRGRTPAPSWIFATIGAKESDLLFNNDSKKEKYTNRIPLFRNKSLSPIAKTFPLSACRLNRNSKN